MITLSGEEKKALLALARETISAALERRPPAYAAGPEVKGNLRQPGGAFVTIHIGRELRGCIGRLSSPDPLEETVRRMARAAAFEDPRFPPVSAGEWQRCHLEISVLSPMESCPDFRQVVVGRDGLYLTYRGRSGVFLPQVPEEQGWDLEAYLEHLCVKAGVPAGSYRQPGAELFTFTAVVFSEPAG